MFQHGTPTRITVINTTKHIDINSMAEAHRIEIAMIRYRSLMPKLAKIAETEAKARTASCHFVWPHPCS